MNKFLVFLCAMSLVFGAVGTARASIIVSDVWDSHEYYLVSYAYQSWDAATADMNTLLGSGFHLATITTPEEQVFIKSLLEYVDVGKGEYWLGGFQDAYDDGQVSGEEWNWVTSETWAYTYWGAGEPNDYYSPGTEQYLGIWTPNGEPTWNDEGNLGNIAGYIAESGHTPEPATMLLLGSGLIGLAVFGRKKFFNKA